MKNGTLRVPAIRFRQGDKVLYIANMTAGDLLKVMKLDVWDPELDIDTLDQLKKQGYQRAPVKSHYSKVARYILRDKRALLPTAILLSSRGELTFDEADRGGADGIGMLRLAEDEELFVVDGQHRLEGFRYVYLHHGAKEALSTMLPVVIIENMEKVEEITQFYVINTTARRIRTDLAHRLLLQLSMQDKSVENEIKEGGKTWRLRATRITDMLNEVEGSPWYHRIKPPNAPNTADTKLMVATEASFSASLRPILTSELADRLVDDKELVGVISNFWAALSELMPTAFKDPKKHVVQKTPGLYTLHMVAPLVFDICGDDLTKDAIKRVLTQAEDIFEDEFWQSVNGHAATANSMGAFRVLADDIKQALPRVGRRIKI